MKNLASIASAVLLLCLATALVSGILFDNSEPSTKEEKKTVGYLDPQTQPAPTKPAPATAPSQPTDGTMTSLEDIPSKPLEPRTVSFNANSEVQILMSKDGRKIEAKILALDEDNVTIFRPDLYQRFSLQRNELDADSQQLLEEWHAYNNPLNATKTRTVTTSTDSEAIPFDTVDWDAVFE